MIETRPGSSLGSSLGAPGGRRPRARRRQRVAPLARRAGFGRGAPPMSPAPRVSTRAAARHAARASSKRASREQATPLFLPRPTWPLLYRRARAATLSLFLRWSPRTRTSGRSGAPTATPRARRTGGPGRVTPPRSRTRETREWRGESREAPDESRVPHTTHYRPHLSTAGSRLWHTLAWGDSLEQP